MAQTSGPKPALAACLLQLVLLTSASPLQARGIARLHDRGPTTTTTTVWIAPTTLTVNPLDPTITREAGWTTTVGPPPFTSTITSSCITYDYRYPPEAQPPSVTTVTVTARSTITVADTNRPPVTHISFHTPTVTVTTPLGTLVSYHCLNTLVVQYHDWEYLTWTWSNWEHTSTTTGLCLTSSTRSTTIPGVTLPTSGRTLEDWEYFSGTNSVATKNSVGIVTDTIATFPGTTTRTVCNSLNPSPTTTTTITITRRPTTTTATATTTVFATDPSLCTGAAKPRQEGADAGNTPVEVHTVVYTTVTVINNTAMTLTGTAVVDVNTQTFPQTRIAYATTTGAGTGVVATSTYTSRVCSLPSAS